MGLAASQARLLFLTTRGTDVEAKMQSISNQKLALARQSASLAAKYAQGMNAQKLTWGSKDNSPELTYSAITNSNEYILTNSYGGVILPNGDLASLLGEGGSGDDFVKKVGSLQNFLQLVGVSADQIAAYNNTLSTKGDAANKFETAYTVNQVFSNGDTNATGLLKTYLEASWTLWDPTDTLSVKGVKKEDIEAEAQAKGLSVDQYKATDAYNKKYMVGAGDAAAIQAWYEGKSDKHPVNWQNLHESLSALLAQGLENTLCIEGGLSAFSSEIQEACAYAKDATEARMIYGICDNSSLDYKSSDDKLTRMSSMTSDEKGKREYGLLTDLGNNTYTDHSLQRFGYSKVKDENGNDKYVYGQTGDKAASVTISGEEYISTYLAYFDKYCEEHFSNSKTDNKAGNGAYQSKEIEAINENIVNAGITYTDYTQYKQTSLSENYLNIGSLKAGDINSVTKVQTGGGEDSSPSYDYTQIKVCDDKEISDADLKKLQEKSVTEGGTFYTQGVAQNYMISNTGTFSTKYAYAIKKDAIDTVRGTSATQQNLVGGKAAAAVDSNTTYWVRMYNQLAKNGWQHNSKVATDKSYLQQQMLYGNIQVAKFTNTENVKRFSVNDNNGLIGTVEDEKAIERAEKEMEAEQALLDFKEQMLDVQMSNLDAEKTAIDTEKSSVQKLIESNVKAFKLFA